ncbi:hypothetical protein BDR22DRAFT_819319 [Usnea florida]
MSTARMTTRSASKAHSTGARSTGAPSVAGSSRAGSRRASRASSLEEEDKPSVGNQVTRAYGTEDGSAQAQLLSAQIGVTQAVNPIANAVSRAQATDSPIANPFDRLPTLSEEPEGSEGGAQRFLPGVWDPNDRRPRSIRSEVSPPPLAQPQRSFLSRLLWGPRRGGFNAEDSSLRRPYGFDEPQMYRPNGPPSWVDNVRNMVLVFILLFALIMAYEATRTSIFGVSEDLETGKQSNISYLLEFLQRRVTKIEQSGQGVSLESTSESDNHQINWFTPGFGAGIDLYLSSPTLSECDPSWTPDGWPWSMFKSQKCPQISMSAPHYEALSPWNDPVDDSWCAPPSDGKLQLTVVLPRNIAPTELVIEHAAMDEMPVGFMGSSPREVEMWIRIPNDDTRAAFRNSLGMEDPTLLEDSSPQGKTIGAQALPFDYLRIGRWEYDIYTNQRQQIFQMPLNLNRHGISTNTIAVRVNSNWGNVKFTCLSRLRLHGEDRSGITERLEKHLF